MPGSPGTGEGRILAHLTPAPVDRSRTPAQRPSGAVRSFRVHNPAFLRDLKAGDDVEAVYTEALAVIVEPAKKR